MRLTRGHPSTAFSINFSGKPGQPTPRRRQDQSRPLLQLPQWAATQSKGTGSLFLRRKVASSVPNSIMVLRRRRAVVWLTPWAALDRLSLATDPPRCRGLIIAMAFPERSRRHLSGTVRVALPQRARSRPHPHPPLRGRDRLANPPPSPRRSPPRCHTARRHVAEVGGSCSGGGLGADLPFERGA